MITYGSKHQHNESALFASRWDARQLQHRAKASALWFKV